MFSVDKMTSRLRVIKFKARTQIILLSRDILKKVYSYKNKVRSKDRFQVHSGLLRNEYSAYNNRLIRLYFKLKATTPTKPHNLNVIEDARVEIFWGEGKRQIVGEDYIKTNQTEENISKKSEYELFDSPSKINVLTLCAVTFGGAGTGSMRRIQALRSIGINARLLSLFSAKGKAYVGRIKPTLDALDTSDEKLVWSYITNIFKYKISAQPYYLGREFFSLTQSVVKLKQLKPLIDDVDIVHLHWVVGLLEYEGMQKAFKTKPIVWTTADMNPFTGGCHYSEGCTQFMDECSNCPMIGGANDLPHQAWKIKNKAYEGLNITLICPSEYIASLARKSSLMRDKKIEVIPNAYPVDQFIPVSKIIAAQKLNLPVNKKLVLFGALSLWNIRKGGDLISKIAKQLHKSRLHDNIEFVCIGESHINLPFKVHNLGKLKQDELFYAYSAADVYVSLSREDVGPMTVVESLLCGTPVVGFSIGVLPEVTIHNLTGRCVEPFDVSGITEGILYFLSNNDEQDDVRESCRRSALRYADPKLSANRHKRLYEKLIKENADKQ